MNFGPGQPGRRTDPKRFVDTDLLIPKCVERNRARLVGDFLPILLINRMKRRMRSRMVRLARSVTYDADITIQTEVLAARANLNVRTDAPSTPATTVNDGMTADHVRILIRKS